MDATTDGAEPAAQVGTSRPGGRAARVREAVLHATIGELLDRGTTAFTIESVAARAGVARSTVHRRWPNRHALIADALMTVTDTAIPVPDTGDIAADLRSMARHVVAMLTDPTQGALMRVLILASGEDEQIARLARTYWSRRASLLAPRLAAAVEAGRLPPCTDPREAVNFIAAPLLFRFLVSHESLDQPAADSAVADYLAMLRGRTAG